MSWFRHNRKDTLIEMEKTLVLLEKRDPETLQQLASDNTSTLAGMDSESRVIESIRVLKESIAVVKQESTPYDHEYHSRDPLTGVIQSALEDDVIPEMQATGQGAPLPWIPAGIRGLLQRFRELHPFQTATSDSRIKIPDECVVALLSDWGAPNVHAERLAEVVMARNRII